MEEVVTGWRKLPARMRWVIAGSGEVLKRWLALPVGYLSLLSVGLWIAVATFDVPRTAQFKAAVWPFIGAVMLISGFELALAHLHRLLPRARSLLRVLSALVWIMVIAGFMVSNHAAGMSYVMYGMNSLLWLWRTRRR